MRRTLKYFWTLINFYNKSIYAVHDAPSVLARRLPLSCKADGKIIKNFHSPNNLSQTSGKALRDEGDDDGGVDNDDSVMKVVVLISI